MKTQSCNPELITGFLADLLSEDQQTSFEQHLDECDTCCAALQQRTADQDLWHDAKTFLSSADNVAAASTADESSPTSPQESLRLEFLAPTDDPRMLGRFAGYEISGVVGCGGMGIVLKGFCPESICGHQGSCSALCQQRIGEAAICSGSSGCGSGCS